VRGAPTAAEAAALRAALAYDRRTGIFTWRTTRGRVVAGNVAGGLDRGYVVIYFNGRKYRAHLLAWLFAHGVWPDRIIDHRNTRRADNRLRNLRVAAHVENCRNTSKRKGTTSRFKGVSWDAAYGRWRAQIMVGGKTITLGRFAREDDAGKAYRRAAAERFGEFARAA
jgi:hypothetical protein